MPETIVKLALPIVAVASLAAAAAWSQEEPEDPTPAEESAEGAPGEGSADGAAEEAEAENGEDGGGPAVGLDEIPELDEQTHQKDDDDFIPTEEIPVDQAIPFPTDI